MTDYASMAAQIRSLAEEERGHIPLLANAAAVIYHGMEGINWAGFYLADGEDLLLGPFQGNAACIRIKKGKGVCEAAVLKGSVLRVDDVHAFPGHIACDEDSRSELVAPIISGGRTVGVLDIDSPAAGRFDENDEKGVALIAGILGGATDFSSLVSVRGER